MVRACRSVSTPRHAPQRVERDSRSRLHDGTGVGAGGGAGTVITSGHRIDFTDRVTLGKNCIIGGRSSSLWTHNRQETAPIQVGDYCYLGSEVRLAPGVKLPDECILGMGAVLAGEIREARSLVAGVQRGLCVRLTRRTPHDSVARRAVTCRTTSTNVPE